MLYDTLRTWVFGGRLSGSLVKLSSAQLTFTHNGSLMLMM